MRARNDALETGRGVSWLVVRVLLVAAVASGALLLCPVVGWRIAAIVAALTAAVLPQTLAAWGSVACIVIGMLQSDPSLGRAAAAVALVHLIHVLGALALILPSRSRATFAALRPTAIRFLSIQAVAQPFTAVVMLASGGSAASLPWAVVAGALAATALCVLLVVRANRVARPGSQLPVSHGGANVRGPS